MAAKAEGKVESRTGGLKEGMREGERKAREESERKAREEQEESVRRLWFLGVLTEEQIVQAMSLA